MAAEPPPALAFPRPTAKYWPVGEGAWQIRLPLPWQLVSVNVFLFRRGGDYLLLDTGLRSEESLESLESALKCLNVGWDSIAEVLVSHLHPDHFGAAAEIRRRSGAPVRMPMVEAELVRPLGPGREFFAEAAGFLGRHGVPLSEVATMRDRAAAGATGHERLDVDGGLAVGERIDFDGGTLTAVAAPGHSPAQLCFVWPEARVLFSTDAILPKITPNIGVQWFYQEDPLGDYFGTLDRLWALDVDRVVPSHGRPFRGHRDWIDGTRRHHHKRCDSIEAVLGAKPIHAYEIAGRVWGEDRTLLDRRFAMSESLSHLHYMAGHARVARVESNGITRWARA